MDEDDEDDARGQERSTNPTSLQISSGVDSIWRDNNTKLTGDHIKAMLRDTSDIVLQNVPHLAAWPRDDAEEEYGGICPALQRLPTERLLARPCIGDDGGLAPELLALWGRNMCKITGKVGTQLPFRMHGEEGEEKRNKAKELIEANNSEDEDDSNENEDDMNMNIPFEIEDELKVSGLLDLRFISCRHDNTFIMHFTIGVL